MSEPRWREQFDDLRRRRSGLAGRVCRALLIEMQRTGLLDFDDLDQEMAALLRLGGVRGHSDPNRPRPQLPAGS